MISLYKECARFAPTLLCRLLHACCYNLEMVVQCLSVFKFPAIAHACPWPIYFQLEKGCLTSLFDDLYHTMGAHCRYLVVPWRERVVILKQLLVMA